MLQDTSGLRGLELQLDATRCTLMEVQLDWRVSNMLQHQLCLICCAVRACAEATLDSPDRRWHCNACCLVRVHAEAQLVQARFLQRTLGLLLSLVFR